MNLSQALGEGRRSWGAEFDPSIKGGEGGGVSKSLPPTCEQ